MSLPGAVASPSPKKDGLRDAAVESDDEPSSDYLNASDSPHIEPVVTHRDSTMSPGMHARGPSERETAAYRSVHDVPGGAGGAAAAAGLGVDTEAIAVFCVTWNLHGLPSPSDLSRLLPPQLETYSILAIGTQECEQSIEMSFLYNSKAPWENTLCNCVGRDFTLIKAFTLNATHLAIFVHRRYIDLVHSLDAESIATGIGNYFGNKGAVAVTFSIDATSFLFICSHLAAGHSKVHDRNTDFARIRDNILLTSPFEDASAQSRLSPFERFDRVVWLGDLNYRIEGSREVVDYSIASGMLEVLLGNDQLSRVRSAGEAFVGFEEAPITFMPTYKFDKGTSVYDTSAKQRVPAWTDRILYYKPSDGAITVTSYTSIAAEEYSDHKPVVAVLSMGLLRHARTVADAQSPTSSAVCTLL